MTTTTPEPERERYLGTGASGDPNHPGPLETSTFEGNPADAAIAEASAQQPVGSPDVASPADIASAVASGSLPAEDGSTDSDPGTESTSGSSSSTG